MSDRPTPGHELRKVLHEKLDELQLHDDTGDPHDEGYMRALTDVREIVASLSLGLPDEEGQNDLGYEQPPAAGACGPSPDVQESPADDGCFCDDYGMCWNCAPRAVRAVVTVARRISEKGAVAGELANLRETFRVLDSDGPVPATYEAKAAGPERPEVAPKQEGPSVRDVTGEGER